MPELAQRRITEAADRLRRAPTFAPLRTDVDEAAARRSLRDQIAQLERELARALHRRLPAAGPRLAASRSPGGPRLLGVGELEALRDDLAGRLEDARGELRDRGLRRARQPATGSSGCSPSPQRFKWVRISNEDIGEPGCKHWHSRPRLGLIGMLMGWWRVKISSGCP